MTSPVTPQGLANLQKELQYLLKVERPKVIQEIAEARGYGDLSENAEYHAAKERQNFIENRINELETKISTAQVVDISALSGPTIYFGATVVLQEEHAAAPVTYQIVGIDEANVKEGKLSISSHLARELIGKSEGMSFEFNSPGGEKFYKILSVTYVSQ